MKAELDRMVAGVSDSAKKAVRFSPFALFASSGPLTTLALEEVRSLTLPFFTFPFPFMPDVIFWTVQNFEAEMTSFQSLFHRYLLEKAKGEKLFAPTVSLLPRSLT